MLRANPASYAGFKSPNQRNNDHVVSNRKCDLNSAIEFVRRKLASIRDSFVALCYSPIRFILFIQRSEEIVRCYRRRIEERDRAFFLADKHRHYDRLNTLIFKPLQSLQLVTPSRDQRSPAYDTDWWRRLGLTWVSSLYNSNPMLLTALIHQPIYDEVKKHLERFDSALPDAISQLESSVRAINDEADSFVKGLRERCISVCSAFGRVTFGEGISDQSYVDVNLVMRILQYFFIENVYGK